MLEETEGYVNIFTPGLSSWAPTGPHRMKPAVEGPAGGGGGDPVEAEPSCPAYAFRYFYLCSVATLCGACCVWVRRGLKWFLTPASIYVTYPHTQAIASK